MDAQSQVEPLDAFIGACESGDLSIIQCLLESKYFVLNRDTLEDMETDLTEVVETKKWHVLELLMLYGLTVNHIKDELYYHLSKSNDEEGYKYWIAKGLSLRDRSARALEHATFYGHSELVIFLAERNADIDFSEYVQDWPPIIYAVRNCSIAAVKSLVARGVNTRWNDDMIFRDEIWKGDDYGMLNMPPRQDMIDYLTELKNHSEVVHPSHGFSG